MLMFDIYQIANILPKFKCPIYQVDSHINRQ